MIKNGEIYIQIVEQDDMSAPASTPPPLVPPKNAR
jgi:hypothetical protein